MKSQASSSNTSRVSKGLQRYHHREGNDVYGAKEEELEPAFIDKGSYACDRRGLPLTAIDIGGENIMIVLDTLKRRACAR